MSSPSRRRVVAAPARERAELRGIRVIFEPSDDEKFVVHAEADVLIEGIVQTLTSAGIDGVEGDAEQEFIEEVVAEEWIALRNVLKTIGVPTSELPLEVDRIWIEWST